MSKVKFYVNGSDIPGEAELKVFENLFSIASGSSYSKEDSILVHGNDTDLILLGTICFGGVANVITALASGLSNMVICQEQNKECIDISVMWKYLQQFFPKGSSSLWTIC